MLPALLACSADKPMSPDERMAAVMSAVADSAAASDDFRVAEVLKIGAEVIEAGGQVARVPLVFDGQTVNFNVVAWRGSYSNLSCARELGMAGDSGQDTVDTETFNSYCAPWQVTLAWDDGFGRIVDVFGDTGTVGVDPDSYVASGNFSAFLYFRSTQEEWESFSGTQTARVISTHGPCRRNIAEEGYEYACTLGTMRHSFEAALAKWPDPDTTHTVTMPATSLRGLLLHLIKVEFTQNGAAGRPAARRVAALARRQS